MKTLNNFIILQITEWTKNIPPLAYHNDHHPPIKFHLQQVMLQLLNSIKCFIKNEDNHELLYTVLSQWIHQTLNSYHIVQAFQLACIRLTIITLCSQILSECCEDNHYLFLAHDFDKINLLNPNTQCTRYKIHGIAGCIETWEIHANSLQQFRFQTVWGNQFLMGAKHDLQKNCPTGQVKIWSKLTQILLHKL